MNNSEIVLRYDKVSINHLQECNSKRTLPLPDQVYEMLIEIRAKQELYKKMFKSSYSREYDDYVCVNQLGELMKPSYVTEHFAAIIQVL